MSLDVYAVVLDSSDAVRLAEFWSHALGRPVDPDGTAEFASIGMRAEGSPQPRLMFMKVPENKTAKNRVHLDLIASSFDDEVARLLALGATKGDEHEEDGSHWATFADPDGNEFDVIADQA